MINLEMTSLEIAELTGKQHKHVNETIRKKLLPVIEVGRDFDPSIFSIELITYKDKSQRKQNTFKLNKFSANALMAFYDIQFSCKLVSHLNKLEQKLVNKEEELLLMKSLVWKVINEKSYLSREYALKSAGITHPRLFMKYLRSNENFYNITHEKGYLKDQHVSPDTRVEMFTKEGFKWLLESREKANTWVENQKVLWKKASVVF